MDTALPAPQASVEATSTTVTPKIQKAPVKKKPVAKKVAAPVKTAPVKAEVKETKPVTKGNTEKKGKKMETKTKKPGPAMVKFASKIKAQYTVGECHFRGCTKKSVTHKAKWCLFHKKLIRKAQLKANNAVWHRRVKAGTAGHHVVYDSRPTVWTLLHKDKALKAVKAGVSIVPTVKALEEIIRKAPEELKKAVRRG